ncbi:MAG: HD domain-containing protein [Candidatus Odinarchaeota archaeon]
MDFRRAIFFLVTSGCSPDVIYHSIQVSKMTEYLACKIKKNGHVIDIELTTVGGLLHDVGRARTHGIDHGVEGGKLLREIGEISLAEIAERHIGGGIVWEEARELNLPVDDYLPITLEQKVVCYADKLFQYQFDRDHRIKSFNVEKDASREIMKLREKLGDNHGSHIRLLKLEEELTRLAGELPGAGFETRTDIFKS